MDGGLIQFVVFLAAPVKHRARCGKVRLFEDGSDRGVSFGVVHSGHSRVKVAEDLIKAAHLALCRVSLDAQLLKHGGRVLIARILQGEDHIAQMGAAF